MATNTASFSKLSLSPSQYSSQSNTIDLTQDDDYNSPRLQKRIRIDDSSWNNVNKPQIQSYPSGSHIAPPNMYSHPVPSPYHPATALYRPPFPAQNPFLAANMQPPRPPFNQQFSQFLPQTRQGTVIDLTSSPSPPPQLVSRPPPEDLAQKTPVCIGQLQVTALVTYPLDFLKPKEGEPDWASVRLQYEHNPNHLEKKETIHLKTPGSRGPGGEPVEGMNFAYVEQKVASYLGPMLGKGLIRLDAKVRKGPPEIPTLPLQMLVYTPKGNIDVVGKYLFQCQLYLEAPSPPHDHPRVRNYHYFNPHPQLPRPAVILDSSRWATAAGKSVEVQRSQVDEIFNTLKDEDVELDDTEPAADVATPLYSHQKKALTFLLQREREKRKEDGTFPSLWHLKGTSMSQASWVHAVTQKEVFKEPNEAKGAILADDMGLGKTITCVSLMAATLSSARDFAASSLSYEAPKFAEPQEPDASHFAGAVWGMPEINSNMSAKEKAKAQRVQDKLEASQARNSRIKTKSRATLILCPLSTVSNWEDQFREHWKGEVQVVGGSGNTTTATATPATTASNPDNKDVKSCRVRQGTPLRVYVYHGSARRPDPAFLADFDAVITTYATLASEYSKQSKSIASADADDDDEGSSDGAMEVDACGNPIVKLGKPKKLKRKLSAQSSTGSVTEATSALQSVYWFRVVLDEAHSIKETGTVASRASCDLMADRRLCLTGTPVQNKLDDLFALIKFLRLDPLDEKTAWTEFIGTPVKFQQPIGVARLQTVMKCITLRRTKESKTQDGKRILNLPPRRDELRYLKFEPTEQVIYDRFFNESKAEFEDLSDKNEVMKNYVGILQKILRLRQICDHIDLVEGKGPQAQEAGMAYEDIVTTIAEQGLNQTRASAIFNLLRESATTQCVECGGELGAGSDGPQADMLDEATPKRPRKNKPSSRAPTRANSPTTTPRPVLTRCQHLFCLSCYRNCICPGWPDVPSDILRSCSTCQTGLCPSDAIEIKPESLSEGPAKKKAQKREKRAKGPISDSWSKSTKVKTLINDLVLSSRGNPHSSNYDPSSLELQMVDNEGNQLDDGIIKTVVFSQWTSMLDKIEDALYAVNIQFDRLDGTMKREERSRAMDALKYDPACEVLLVSLKAGGVGLNLTAAQRVYLMDPYWNPAVENQAVDRIHRLGQTKPVSTIKLIIENSIEARLLEVQKKKIDLANMTLGGATGFSKSEMMARRMEELNQLFE